jgi:UDP-3-O-[3-hydroxymyristoyl] glucosamine N-acyltransferase
MQINLSVKDLVGVIGGQTKVDPSFQVSGISALESAGPRDLSVIFEPDTEQFFPLLSQELIKKSNAGVFLARKEVVPGKDYILVDDPLAAFQKLVEHVAAQHEAPSLIHPSAHVDASVHLDEQVSVDRLAVIDVGTRIGKNSKIGAQVYVGRDCRIGENVVLYPGVRLLQGTIIGNHTIIHAGTVIGSDGFGYRITKQGLKKIPQIGRVRIGSYVEIGANCCIDRGAFEETVLGDGVKLDNLVHIAHNVKIGHHTAIIAQTGIAGSTTIGSGCMIGGQVAIKDHVNVGNGVRVVSKTALVKDAPDGAILAGIPAMPFGEWKRLVVVLMRLPGMLSLLTKIETMLAAREQKKSFWKRFWS